MEQTEQINELATALAKAQAAMAGAVKDSTNTFFKSNYADLESVWTACRKPLTDNGLAVIQGTEADEAGITITTQLCHTSGQWVRGHLRLMPKDATPQGIGSAISYGRRYALAAMVGVYQTDDDAEAAHGRSNGAHAGVQAAAAFNRDSHDSARCVGRGKYKDMPWADVPQDYLEFCARDTTGKVPTSLRDEAALEIESRKRAFDGADGEIPH